MMSMERVTRNLSVLGDEGVSYLDLVRSESSFGHSNSDGILELEQVDTPMWLFMRLIKYVEISCLFIILMVEQFLVKFPNNQI